MTVNPDISDLGAEFAPEEPPKGPVVWMRENLVSSWFNGALSIIFVVIAVAFVRGIVSWMWDAKRGWEAVATNLRLYMVQAYPAGPEETLGVPDQFIRVWIAVGVVVALTGLSVAAWRVGSRVELRNVFKGLRLTGAIIGVFALLGPPSEDVEWGLGILGSFAGFIWESVAMSGGRLIVFLVAAAIYAVFWYAEKAMGERAKDTIHSLWVPLGGLVLIVVALWVVPFGHYSFSEGQPQFEPGTIAASTKGPWTALAVLLVLSYFVGRAALRVAPERLLRGVLSLGWVLALPFIVLIILRDPDWSLGNPGGGFDFLSGQDVTIWAVFALGGGAVIAFLSLPRLGEAGRALGGVAVVLAIAVWLFPMLIKVRLLMLLFAVIAVGAPTFAGDRRARIRYLALWIGTVTVLIYFLAAITTPSTLVISGKSFLGGLALTFVLALTSISLSFPIGVLMALGRTSTMPIFRVLSTVYIELVRGIPFITVLIFFDLILVLFLPEGLEFDSVTLAILGGTLFSGAYLAENVRGGLQSIPNGQYEAAKAMGLSTLQTTVFIILPQALRAVIPALVGQTIAIFKDTSLVAIIGLFDFLYIADKVIPAQTVFLGIRLENLIFIAGVYWIFTFSFSRASLRIEKKVGLGER